MFKNVEIIVNKIYNYFHIFLYQYFVISLEILRIINFINARHFQNMEKRFITLKQNGKTIVRVIIFNNFFKNM